MPSAPANQEKRVRHSIPTSFRVNRVSSSNVNDDDIRPASRFFIAGNDTVTKLKKLEKAIEIVFAGSVFGGFSRVSGKGDDASGVWEIIVNVNRHRAELPCVKEIEKVIEFSGMSAAVEHMDEKVCNHVVACVARLSQFALKIGSFPKGFRREVQHYNNRMKEEDERHGVEQYTGRSFNATTFMVLHQNVSDVQRQMEELKNKLEAQRKTIQSKSLEVNTLTKRVSEYQEMLSTERKRSRMGVIDYNLHNSRMAIAGEHLKIELPRAGEILFDADSIPDVFNPARDSIPASIHKETIKTPSACPNFPFDPFNSIWVGGVPLPEDVVNRMDTHPGIRTVCPLPDFDTWHLFENTQFPPPGAITQRVAIREGTHLRDYQFSWEWKGKRVSEYPYFIDFSCRETQPIYSMTVQTRNPKWQDLPDITPVRTRAKRQADGTVRIDLFTPLSACPFVQG
jgi:hypothetical protein